MGIDIFAESCRFYEDEHKDIQVVILDKSILDRLDKWCKDNNCEIGIDEFIEKNLEALGY